MRKLLRIILVFASLFPIVIGQRGTRIRVGDRDGNVGRGRGRPGSGSLSNSADIIGLNKSSLNEIVDQKPALVMFYSDR